MEVGRGQRIWTATEYISMQFGARRTSTVAGVEHVQVLGRVVDGSSHCHAGVVLRSLLRDAAGTSTPRSVMGSSER
jgi:hypothetical protein